MSKRQDITDQDDDQELDLEEPETEEGEEEGDDKPTPKPAKQPSEALKEIKGLKASLAQLQGLIAGNATKEDKKAVSNLDAMLEALVQGGYDKQEVAVLAATLGAVTKDLEAKYESRTGQDRVNSLNAQYKNAVEREVDVYVEQYGKSVEYAKERLVREIRDHIVNDDKFTEPFKEGRLPSQTEFRKATAKILGTYLKETGIKKSEANQPEQLDLKSSAKKSSPAISKDGTVDTKKLTDFEREVYQQTLNITKNKDIALEALRTVKGKSFD